MSGAGGTGNRVGPCGGGGKAGSTSATPVGRFTPYATATVQQEHGANRARNVLSDAVMVQLYDYWLARKACGVGGSDQLRRRLHDAREALLDAIGRWEP